MMERALVVDDDATVRQLCRRALAEMGFEVAAAGDGAEARVLLSESAYDLVLTDVHMAVPGEGVRLAEEVTRRTPDTCVIVMTGQPSLDTAIPSLKYGAADYLHKPFQMAHLRAVVERCLQQRRLARELQEERALRKELESAYAQLQKAEEAKDAVLARLSHEFRTPLTIALMASTVVAEKLPDDEARSLMGKLNSALSGLQQLLEDLLLYAKLSRHEFVIQDTDVDLGALLRGLVDRHHPLWEERGLTVNLGFDGDPRPLHADKGLLETAFRHLLLNAIRFNEPQGEVMIRCDFRADEVLVYVEDTGIGIPEDQLSNVFDGLYQVAEYWTREHGGLGLGLATARRIIEAHRGSIVARRRTPRGMTFLVGLRYQAKAPSPAPV